MRYAILILFTIFWLNVAYASGVVYTDFLVEKQVQPHVILIDQDAASSESDFSLKDGSGKNLPVHYESTFIDVNPVLLANKSKYFIGLGLGFMEDYFGEDLESGVSDYYSGSYLSLYGVGEIAPKWNINTYLSYGFFSSDNVKTGSEYEKTLITTSFGYKRNNNEIYKFGALYSSNLGEGFVIPLLGLSYSRGNMVLDAMLPRHISLRNILGKKIHSVASIKAKYSSYYDENRKDILEIVGSEVDGRLEYKLYKSVWVNLGASYVPTTELRWVKEDVDHAEIGAHFQINGGVNMRF